MKLRDTLPLFCLAAIAVATSPVNAAIIVKPMGADQSSFNSATYEATSAINGSGLSAFLGTGAPVPGSWPTHDTDQAGSHTQWMSGGTLAGTALWVMFDLGQNYQLTGMHIWNWNDSRNLERGINTVDVKFATSLSAAFGSADSSDSMWGMANPMTFAQAPGVDTYSGENFDLTPVTARYVLFDIKSNHLLVVPADPLLFTGLAETRFIAVPEPSAALLGGLGALFLLRRRR